MKELHGADAQTHINDVRVTNEYQVTIQDECERIFEVYASFDYDEYNRLRQLLMTIVDVRITGVLNTVKANITGIVIKATNNDVVRMNISLKEVK